MWGAALLELDLFTAEVAAEPDRSLLGGDLELPAAVGTAVESLWGLRRCLFGFCGF